MKALLAAAIVLLAARTVAADEPRPNPVVLLGTTADVAVPEGMRFFGLRAGFTPKIGPVRIGIEGVLLLGSKIDIPYATLRAGFTYRLSPYWYLRLGRAVERDPGEDASSQPLYGGGLGAEAFLTPRWSALLEIGGMWVNKVGSEDFTWDVSLCVALRL